MRVFWCLVLLIYIYIYIYIYCHPQTDCFVVSQLFSVAIHVGRLKLGSKPAQLYVRLSIIQLSQQTNHVSSGIIRHYVAALVCLHFCLTGYQSAQFVRRALHYASGKRKFLHQSARSTLGSVYIYIYMYMCVCVCVCFNYSIIILVTLIIQFDVNHFLHTVKWFQVLLFNINNSFNKYSFVI